MDKTILCELPGNFIIRYAVKDDCKNLLHLIQELAECLDSLNEAAIDINTLQKYGFDTDTPLYKCLVIEDLSIFSDYKNNNSETQQSIKETVSERNPLVAYALFSFSFSSWYGKGLYLEDIYISKVHRGKGFGNLLFKNISKIALESQCDNITMFVFKTNKMKQFFLSKGAENLTVKNGFDYYKIDKNSMIGIAND